MAEPLLVKHVGGAGVTGGTMPPSAPLKDYTHASPLREVIQAGGALLMPIDSKYYR